MADVMSKHTASELVYNKRNLFRVETTTTVEEALKLIRKYNVLSLPVYDSKKSEFVGIVTALDLLAYVAFASFDYKDEPSAEDLHFKFTHTPIVDLVGVAEEIRSGINIKGVHVLPSTATFREVLDPMTIGIQRLLVSSDDGFRLLSQTDLVRWLFIHEDELGDTVLGTLDDMGLGKSPVHTVPENQKTLTALREIYTSPDIDALAVVDERGVLIGTLSPSDVRQIDSTNVTDVLLPVGDFLRKHNHGQLRRPVSMQINRSLSVAMAKAVMGSIHRVWVVDDAGKPIGQVTLEDILGKFGPFSFRRLSYTEAQKILARVDSEAKDDA